MNIKNCSIDIWRKKKMNEENENTVDYEKLDETKELLLKVAEEYINEGVKISVRDKVDKVVRLVGKKYDF